MQQRSINAPSAPAPLSAYSQAQEVTGVTRWLFISGQVGMDVAGNVPHTMAEQSALAWRNVGTQLAAAGMDSSNLVKVTMIVPDREDLPGSRPAREKALGNHRPASTVIIAGLADPTWKIEIEAIACA